jgi:hypothetical protein
MNEVKTWCAQKPAAVLCDEKSATLRDVFSGKTLRLPRVQATEEKTAPNSGEKYLVLLLDDGRQLALASVGIAFPPELHHSGPLPGMPQTVCWRDFANVTRQIEHALCAHPDQWGVGASRPPSCEPPGREVLDMLRYCIALCDGARAIGFDVGEEERQLES